MESLSNHRRKDIRDSEKGETDGKKDDSQGIVWGSG